MDKLSVHQRKGAKQAKSKNKPIKVVYISNPMKVKTSASQFRALVQELTGRDSDETDATRFSDFDSVDGVQVVPDQVAKVTYDDSPEIPRVDTYQESPASSDSNLFEPFNDVFTPQMLESFAGFFPSSLTTESLQVDIFRNPDEVV
ncbi:PREDICTED: sigma factor binding protein 1, chloroplastic-like [Nelumbo nucifera]|uniref:Sigma factor binding protein 1, chloroplastic-like n=1 Tax=Nelumbo nucifera TaxID=4432 RepID=A0A1U7YY38_NELNU|nr:PREDICTED: sigma factor binding protein 1, chloroplastic-like [Nelumbo nucifera]